MYNVHTLCKVLPYLNTVLFVYDYNASFSQLIQHNYITCMQIIIYFLVKTAHFVEIVTNRNTRMQGVTKRCRLSWLTNSALVYMSPNAGAGGRIAVSVNEFYCTQEPK
jgi:hypothetical protein